MKPAPFSYHAPTELQEALKLLAALAPQDGRILAGGQTLVPTMAFRMARPAHLIDINGIRALDGVVIDGDRLRIGACTRHAYFESDKVPGRLGDLLRRRVEIVGEQAQGLAGLGLNHDLAHPILHRIPAVYRLSRRQKADPVAKHGRAGRWNP